MIAAKSDTERFHNEKLLFLFAVFYDCQYCRSCLVVLGKGGGCTGCGVLSMGRV